MPGNSINIYVDGSFKNGQYAWAFVAYHDGKETYHELGIGEHPEAATMRNVAGELAAAMRAVQWAKKQGYTKVMIHHDYTGIAHWVTGQWKAKKRLTQQYAQFMQPFFQAGFIEFIKVTGHSGNKGNDRADQLAGGLL